MVESSSNRLAQQIRSSLVTNVKSLSDSQSSLVGFVDLGLHHAFFFFVNFQNILLKIHC